jgi:serine protease DegQ
VIVALNGEEVSNSNDLRNDVALLRVGTEIRLDILRHDVPMTVHAVIAEPHITTTNAGSLSKRLAGAMLGRIKDTNPLAGRVEGVEVLQVEHDSPAWAAGLRSGDIIIAVNQISVATVADVMAAIKHDTNGLVLNLIRGDSELMIVVQ